MATLTKERTINMVEQGCFGNVDDEKLDVVLGPLAPRELSAKE